MIKHLAYIMVIELSWGREEYLTSYWRTSSLKCPEDPAQPQKLSATQIIEAKNKSKDLTQLLTEYTRSSAATLSRDVAKNNCSK